jgi:diketogulonate reductase-like aldo/keto reductase
MDIHGVQHVLKFWNILFAFCAINVFEYGSADLEYCTKSNSDSCSRSLKVGTDLSSTIRLNDGVQMPLFGLGLYLAQPSQIAEDAVVFALKNGYRLLDTAQIYGNEADVGRGIRRSGVPREEVFVVSKVYTDAHGYSETIASVNASLERLQMKYVDLFLIHSPYGGRNVDTYQALLDLKKKGIIRSVGVSNFEVQHLEGLREAGLPAPSVNQIELHVFQRREYLVNVCNMKEIAVMGYCPLARAFLLDDPDLVALANKYHKTSAQIMIRWSVQKGYITIPKSVNPDRILENSQVFDFELSLGDMELLDNKIQYTYGWNTSEYSWDN